MTGVFIDSNAVGANDGTSWEDAYNGGGNADWSSALTDASAAVDFIAFASDHLTTLTSDFSGASNANHTLSSRLMIICSSSAGGGTTVDPVDIYDPSAGNGEIDCTGTYEFEISGNWVMYGLRFTSPDSQFLNGSSGNRGATYERCLLLLDKPTTESYPVGAGGLLDLVDTDLEMSGGGNHFISLNDDASGFFMTGGSITTASTVGRILNITKIADIKVDGVDCTGIDAATDLHRGASLLESLSSYWYNCVWNTTLPALWGSTITNIPPQSRIIVSGPQFDKAAQYGNGNLLQETTIRRASGADTGSQTYSSKFESTTTATRTNPMRHVFSVSNPGDVDTLTLKLHFANDQGALTNDEIWIEVRVGTSTGMENESDKNGLGGTATTHTDESGNVDWRDGAGALTGFNEQSCEVTFSATTTGTVWVTVCVAADFTTTDSLYIDPKFVIA